MKKFILLLSLCAGLAFAGTKTKIEYIDDTEVAGNGQDVDTTGIPAAGKTVILKVFGGCIPDIGDGKGGLVAIQWGSGTAYKTVRAFTGEKEFNLRKSFVGDGTKRFRIVRRNFSATAKPIVVWVEAQIDDAT